MAWFADRFIATKIMLAFGLVIGVGALSATSIELNLWRLADADAWAEHTYQALEMSREILSAATRQDRMLRGYARIAEPALLTEARRQDEILDRVVARIRKATADNALQQVRIAKLAAEIGDWRTQSANTQVRDARAETMYATLREIDAEEKRLLAPRTAAARAALQSSFVMNIVGPLVSVGLALIIGLMLRRHIAQPITRLTAAMRRLADGDTATMIPDMALAEEIGAMSRALDVFKTNMIEADRLRLESRSSRERGEADRSALLKSTADRFEKIVGSVVTAVSASASEMESSAAQLLGLADRTSGQATDAARVTRDASATMRTAADETEALSASVGEISARMERSAQVAHKAVVEADRTSATIVGLSEAAKRIHAIVELINAVARQTNLLALNATIESARAGDAGRGFAVVAAEVKLLADQTSEATDDIRRQIEEIQTAASGSVLAIRQISQTIGEMARISVDMTSAIEAQRDSTLLTARNTQETAGMTADVSSRLAVVCEDATTTGRAATHLLTAARDLAQHSKTLREEAGSFVASVLAG